MHHLSARAAALLLPELSSARRSLEVGHGCACSRWAFCKMCSAQFGFIAARHTAVRLSPHLLAAGALQEPHALQAIPWRALQEPHALQTTPPVCRLPPPPLHARRQAKRPATWGACITSFRFCLADRPLLLPRTVPACLQVAKLEAQLKAAREAQEDKVRAAGARAERLKEEVRAAFQGGPCCVCECWEGEGKGGEGALRGEACGAIGAACCCGWWRGWALGWACMCRHADPACLLS